MTAGAKVGVDALQAKVSNELTEFVDVVLKDYRETDHQRFRATKLFENAILTEPKIDHLDSVASVEKDGGYVTDTEVVLLAKNNERYSVKFGHLVTLKGDGQDRSCG